MKCIGIGKYLSDNFHIQNGLKKRRCFITTAFQICFRICHYERPVKPGGTETKWDKSAAVYADDENLLGDNIDTIKKNTGTLTDASKDGGLEVKQRKRRICSCFITRMQGKIMT
jgi:hypothetical protein